MRNKAILSTSLKHITWLRLSGKIKKDQALLDLQFEGTERAGAKGKTCFFIDWLGDTEELLSNVLQSPGTEEHT